MLVRTCSLRAGENVSSSVNFLVVVDLGFFVKEFRYCGNRINPEEILKLYPIDVRVLYNM